MMECNLGVEEIIQQLDKLCENKLELKCIIDLLQELTTLMKTDKFRSELNQAHWETMHRIADNGLEMLSKHAYQPDELDFFAEFLRFLRNCCAGSPTNQYFIISSSTVSHFAKIILASFLQRTGEKEIAVLKCCLQLFGNLICTGSESKPVVWQLFFEEKTFIYLFQNEDKKVQEYSMMVLYNCMSEESSRTIVNTKEGQEVLIAITNSLCIEIIDWGILFLELIMKEEDFMDKCYNILPLKNRLLVLDVIAEQLNNAQENSYFFVPNASIRYIKDLFIKCVLNIVQVSNSEAADLKSIEIVKMLCILCAASISDIYSSVLKTSADLIESSLDTLKSIHLLGKKSCNAFSCISSLKLSDAVSKEEMECHPSFGFKKNLIRLIGNLCYNCKENQDL
ncbi:Ataxin-10, partial [Stegodyphus mimosarum]